MKRFAAVLALVVLMLARLPTTTAQDPADDGLALPFAQRGPYTVGTQETTLTNYERILPTTIWYPAAPVADAALADATLVTYQRSLLQVVGQAFPDAAPFTDAAPYPVVIFSHGAALSSILYTTLLEHIASYGYVVVAIDHPTNTLFDAAFNRPQFETDVPMNFAWRVHDLQAVLGFVDADLNALIDDVADTRHIALMGHSFGGYTALVGAGAQLDFDALAAWCERHGGGPLDPAPTLAFWPYADNPSDALAGSCFLLDSADAVAAELGAASAFGQPIAPLQADPRIRAVVAFAPWQAPLFGARGLAALEAPLLVFGGTADRVTPHPRDAQQIYEWATTANKTLITFEGGGHAIYTDECPALVLAGDGAALCDDPVWDGDVSRAIIAAYTIAFLEETTKGVNGAWTINQRDGITITSTWP